MCALLWTSSPVPTQAVFTMSSVCNLGVYDLVGAKYVLIYTRSPLCDLGAPPNNCATLPISERISLLLHADWWLQISQ